MGTKTIGIREDVYERLKAQKRDGESFTDTVDRLLEESNADWRDGFGSLNKEDTEELEQIAERSRQEISEGMLKRQQDALDELASVSDDEAA